MPRWKVTGYFRTSNDQQLRSGCRRLRFDEGSIAIAMGDIQAVRLIFQVFGDGQRVQAVTQCFGNAYFGPHVAIGKNTVGVQVYYQSFVLGSVRKDNVACR